MGKQGVVNELLWRQALHVPREEDRVANVRDPGHLRHKSLQPKCEPAVWRHPVTECIQVAGEWFRVDPASRQCHEIIIMAMESLPSGDDLQAPEQ